MVSWSLLSSHRFGRSALPLLIAVGLCAVVMGAAINLLTPWIVARRKRKQCERASLIEIHCSHCGQLILVDEQLAGREGRCKHCGQILSIPPRSAPLLLLPTLRQSALARGAISFRNTMSLDGRGMNAFLERFAIVLGVAAVVLAIALLIVTECAWASDALDGLH